MTRTVRILGTHGIPANYGGFETAAENVAKYLVSRGWRVIVYCQAEGRGPIVEDEWHGIERVTIPVDLPGWRGTAKFDKLSIIHACHFRDVCLTFGYNTGIYNWRQRVRGIPNVINMDGIEWSRKRWGFAKQAILYVNERFAALYGNMLIADHPEIEKYLWTRAPKSKLTMIAYGADPVGVVPTKEVEDRRLIPGRYFTLIARPIPENSILDLVRGFTRRQRGFKLVILGKYEYKKDTYHRAVLDASNEEVVFVGPIYDPATVQALRRHCAGYLHGHTVGGTNPSLVEAMAAGNAVVAHDNPYNRWVVGDGALYFRDADAVDEAITRMIDEPALARRLGGASVERFQQHFTWEMIGKAYEDVLLKFVP